MVKTAHLRRRTQIFASMAVGLVCCLLLLSTSPMIPLVWDEPNAILRAEKLECWLVSWINPSDDAPPWNHARIRELCPYTIQREGHPTFYGIVIAVGHLISADFLSHWQSYRFGPILLFSLAIASLFHCVWSMYGGTAAAFSVAFLLTMPRLFAHAHFASIDGPLTSCWVLTWVAFSRVYQRWRWVILWSVLLGTTMSCKSTGWLATVPFLMWSVWRRDLWTTCAVLVGAYLALLTFICLNPPVWYDPVSGIESFVSLNTSRLENGLNIPTYFFGRKYDLKHALPWYNTVAWTILTVPPCTLIFAVIGSVWIAKQSQAQAAGVLILLNWAILPVVRILPWVPPHDAERLILPAFPFLAVLAGIGANVVISSARSRRPSVTRTVWALSLLATSAAVIETTWYGPQWLSYYSPVVGGIRGAAHVGLEPAYYWDGLDSSVLHWLQSNTSDGDHVYCSISMDFEELHERTDQYHFHFTQSHPENCVWYVVQNRPGLWTNVESELVTNAQPKHFKTIRKPEDGFGPWRLDIPIVFVFSRDQYQSARNIVAAKSLASDVSE